MSASPALDHTIQARLAAGEGLIASARMVGDPDDHRFWRLSRDLWALNTVRALTPEVEPAVLHSFQRAVASPRSEGDLAEDLPTELEGLRRGLAVLIGLRAH